MANLTTEEAAARLRLKPQTLERWRMQGKGPKFIKQGGSKRAPVLYREEDIEQYELGNIRTSTNSDRPGAG
jgi:predicted site-specific integrase-resolvase